MTSVNLLGTFQKTRYGTDRGFTMDIFTFFTILIPIITIIVVFRAVKHGSYMAINSLETWGCTLIRDVKRGDDVILSAALITRVFKGSIHLLRLQVILGTLFIVLLPNMFGIFPVTKEFLSLAFEVVFDKFDIVGQGFMAFSPNLLFWVITA